MLKISTLKERDHRKKARFQIYRSLLFLCANLNFSLNRFDLMMSSGFAASAIIDLKLLASRAKRKSVITA